jgi:hypothetical protein
MGVTNNFELIVVPGDGSPDSVLRFSVEDMPDGPRVEIDQASPQLWVSESIWQNLITNAERGWYDHDPEHETLTIRDHVNSRTVVYRLRRDVFMITGDVMIYRLEWPD